MRGITSGEERACEQLHVCVYMYVCACNTCMYVCMYACVGVCVHVHVCDGKNSATK